MFPAVFRSSQSSTAEVQVCCSIQCFPPLWEPREAVAGSTELISDAGRQGWGKTVPGIFSNGEKITSELEIFCEIIPVVQKISYRGKSLCSMPSWCILLTHFQDEIFLFQEKVFESTSFYHLKTSVHSSPSGDHIFPFPTETISYLISQTPFLGGIPNLSSPLISNLEVWPP